MNSKLPIIAIVVVLVTVCICCCLAALGVFAARLLLVPLPANVTGPSFGVTLEAPQGEFPFPVASSTPLSVQPEPLSSPTPVVVQPKGQVSPTSQAAAPQTGPTPTPSIQGQPVDPEVLNSLKTLEDTIVPENDPRDLAMRLGGKTSIPQTVNSPRPTGIGEQEQFWVTNVDTNKTFQVTTTLRYVGQHIYFWIQNGVSYRESDLKKLADTFDQKIYETDRAIFGSEWNPGIDNDPRLYIVYTSGLGSNLAGYFSSADSVPPQAHKYSNAHEMFLLNSDVIGLNQQFTYGVLAHEFQHMIHWYRDRNETSWLNEGFSELAAFLNGYDVGGFDMLYLQNPDLQLNDWPNDQNATGPHYGAGFLFTTYFLDRFGEDATKALVADQANGMESVEDVLKQLHETDPQTGKQLTADDVFADWVVANYLNNPNAGDGRYDYHNYPNMETTGDTENVGNCPVDWQQRDVKQYGADYIHIRCDNAQILSFQAANQVGILPQNAHSGKYAFWSNKGDQSDMTLTHSFDFTNVQGPINLQYYTWYDLEKDYDYLYLEASVDQGQNWQILRTPSGTDQDPSGNSYGWGYNGVTNGWIQEKVDLSQFSGQKVDLRFEYITDAAVNGEGLLLDDVSIPQINYQTNFETDDGGWQGAGFVREQNALPQTFRISLIRNFGQTTVETIAVPAGQTVNIPLQPGDGSDLVLVVSGTTRFTRQEADYRFSIK